MDQLYDDHSVNQCECAAQLLSMHVILSLHKFELVAIVRMHIVMMVGSMDSQ